MADRAEFLNKINHILEIAKENGNRIALEEVKELLAEDQLTEEQVALTCDYLMAQKILVSGYERNENTESVQGADGSGAESEETIEGLMKKLGKEERTYVESYLQDIAQTYKMDSADKMAYYLPRVIEEALKLRVQDIFIGDMIQEGNISLMTALGNEILSEEEILSEIRGGIRVYVDAHTEVRRQDNRMVEKVSGLDEMIREMTEGLGRKVYMDEVAEQMGITENEIEDILKLAGEEVEE